MKRKEINSSRIPVYRDTGFELSDAETASGAFRQETENKREPDLYIYSRYRNPTVVAAEAEIMKLEGSAWALLTQSGMSAIDTALSIFQRGGITRPWLFFSEIYGGTISFAESILKKRRGLDIHSFVPVNESYDLAMFKSVISTLNPELVYIETISNPMLIVPDVAGIIKIARKDGSKIIVDNTFATPFLWKPLESGADIVIHSATKYFSGHGNITAGVLCGNDPGIMKDAIEYRKLVGHMLSADDAYRLHSQIQTIELRFRQQCRNASQVAEILSHAKQIRRVWYPGLKEHPSYADAKKLFGVKGFGGMVTFDFAGKTGSEKRKRRDNFIKAVSDKIRLIPTLGDPRTILLPVEAVWGLKYPEPGMIRLSAGFEDPEELLVTIKKALKKIT
ncbi:MAG: PLP-dependent transferase [Bacteroidales bacterium]|nr:PLP-dependent transferase [Bacteroidales bacterium]